MEFSTVWEKGMTFKSLIGEHHLTMDAQYPLGEDSGVNPKEMLAASLAGCVGMDVVGFLKKYRQQIDSFSIETEIQQSNEGYPITFIQANLTLKLTGEIDESLLLETVYLAIRKYCGVSSMLSKAFPINWSLFLNDQRLGSGGAVTQFLFSLE